MTTSDYFSQNFKKIFFFPLKQRFLSIQFNSSINLEQGKHLRQSLLKCVQAKELKILINSFFQCTLHLSVK